MSGRDANQLAADVRERLRPVQGLDGVQCQCEECVDNAAGFSALDELVALVTDLEARLRDAESITYSGLVTRTLQRAEAAEAQVAALNSDPDGVVRWRGEAEMYMREFGKQRERAEAAEAALAEARETVANLCTRPGTCLADTGGDTAEEGT